MDDLNKYLKMYDDINEYFNNDSHFININEENCVNCFYSSSGYCLVQRKRITQYTPTCWSYRDCFTMRTSSDFQDDNEDFYEYEQGDVLNDW